MFSRTIFVSQIKQAQSQSKKTRAYILEFEPKILVAYHRNEILLASLTNNNRMQLTNLSM